MPDKTADPVRFKRRVKRAYHQIREFIESKNNERMAQVWPSWKERFVWLAKKSAEQPEVAVSLVGGTGAGKSTLLNALIGARVLPVSNMRACTAAITEVAYGAGAYSAKVKFISRESWQAEVDQLQDDIRINLRFNKMEDGDESYGISKVAMDKLKTVYAPVESNTQFDPLKIKEPQEIKTAIDAGQIELESLDLKDFRKQVAQYLDSKHRYWPIVQSVSIQGPFENLKDGAKLIDLPGVNDPNEAREAVTKQHLKTCRFVWIVFNIKRALTKDISNLMQSDDFCRQIVMDGRADALTFVGTASDDIDIDSAIDEFDLDDDADVVEIIKARNTEVRKVVEDQLGDLAVRLAQLGKESPEKAQELATKLKASKIFTISAREYLRLSGLARTKNVTFEKDVDTEVPALVQNMKDVCGRFGTESHIQSLNKQLDLLVEEIKAEIAAQRSIVQNKADITNKQREELGAAVKSARDFLKRDLEDSTDRYKQG
ncbi:dynamin family protein, partial [Mariniblastus sp.]|nr:dynamin family protein [Mariniblastus sp.]